MITLPTPRVPVGTGLYTKRGMECSVYCAENMALRIPKTKARSTALNHLLGLNEKQLKIKQILDNMQLLLQQSFDL